MKRKKIITLVLSAIITSQAVFLGETKVQASVIPTEIVNELKQNSNLTDDVKNLIDKLSGASNPAAVREIVNNDLFKRGLPIENTESVIKQLTSTALGAVPLGSVGNGIKTWILSPLLALIFPDSDQDYIWNKMRPEIQKMIDNSISDYDFGNMKEEILSLRALLDEYITWITEENQSSERIRSKFDNVYDTFIRVMDKLKDHANNGANKVELLPLYTIAANYHLLLTNDMVMHAKERGFDENAINTYTNKYYNLLQEYTGYIENTYKGGFDLLTKTGTGKDIWNTNNSYIRFMQKHVFDLVSLWKYMDGRNYQKPVDFELSREIYSDFFGSNGYCNYDAPHHLSGQYYGEFKGINARLWDRIDWMQTLADRGDGNSIETSNMGNFSGGTQRQFRVDENDEIKSVIVGDDAARTSSPNSIAGFIFTSYNGVTTKLGRSPYSGTNFVYGSGTTCSYEGEKLSGIYPQGLNGSGDPKSGISGVVVGFRPKELNVKNNVSDKNISVFSAQKYIANPTGISAQVEHIFGGNAMNFETKGGILKYKFNAAKSGTYKIRYNVSVKSDAKIKLYNGGQAVNEVSAPVTSTGIQGEYGKYSVIDGATVTLKQGENSIDIENTNGAFSICNIEFIPENIQEPAPPVREEREYRGCL